MPVLAKIIFTLFLTGLSLSMYSNTVNADDIQKCKFRMEVYTNNGLLVSVQEAMNEEEFSLQQIKPGSYRMIITENNGKIIFNAKVIVPAKDVQIAGGKEFSY